MATSMMACRWDWCAQTFPDPGSLRAHIEQDHIGTALPVKRKDVALLRRAEDGISFQESIIPRSWLAETEGSQSQPLAAPNRVERAVMTDLVAPTITAQMSPPGQTPKQVLSLRSGASTPTPVPKPPLQGSILQTTFAEMRGTPSPVPSPVPSSPGITAIINKIKQNAVIPVTPRRSVPASPHATPRTPNLKQSPSKATSKGRRFSPYTYLTPMGDDSFDASGMRAAGVEDPNASMEIVESQLTSMDDMNDGMAVKSTLGVLQSQWQPQSQLPFDGSASFPVSTINPKQLHAPLSFGADLQPMVESGSSDMSISPSKSIVQITPKASQRHGTPSSAPPPPSPSTLDISSIIKTDSQESILRTPFRISRRAIKDSDSSSAPQPSPLPAAGTSGLPDKSASQAESQETDLYEQEFPFDPGYGYGYGGGHGESQQLQTQAMPASYDSSSWSQG